MKKFAIASAAALLSSSAWADPAAEADAAVRAFFAKYGVNGVVEMMDSTAGAKRALTLPAQPEAVYKAPKYHMVSYRAVDAQAKPVDLDIVVQGDEGEREVGLIYVSARTVVQDLVAKGHIAKVR